MNTFQRTGTVYSKQKGGDMKSKLSFFHQQKVKEWVDDNCLLTLKQICQKLYKDHGVRVSQSTVDRCLKKFHFKPKQVSLVPKARNCAETTEKRTAYVQFFCNLEVNNDVEYLIFLD